MPFFHNFKVASDISLDKYDTKSKNINEISLVASINLPHVHNIKIYRLGVTDFNANKPQLQEDSLSGSEDRVNYVLNMNASTKSNTRRMKATVKHGQVDFFMQLPRKSGITPKKHIDRGDKRSNRKLTFCLYYDLVINLLQYRE